MTSGYCTTIWNRRDHGASKINYYNQIKGQSSFKDDDGVYMVGLGALYYELLLENEIINSKKYCFQFDQLKAAFGMKCPELVNRKCIIFHQDTARPRFFDDQAKTVNGLAGKF